SGKAENEWRRSSSIQWCGIGTPVATPERICLNPYFEGLLKIDDPALEPDGDGVSPVVDAQLLKNVFDVTLDAFLGDVQLGSDLLIGVPTRNQLQHADFPWG